MWKNCLFILTKLLTVNQRFSGQSLRHWLDQFLSVIARFIAQSISKSRLQKSISKIPSLLQFKPNSLFTYLAKYQSALACASFHAT